MAGNRTLKSIRVDQVGSLVPGQRWREVADRYKRGEASAEEFRAAQDGAIRDTIARQEAIGLPVVTDRELRRFNFQESFAASVSGFDVPAEVRADYRPSAEARPFRRAEQDFEAVGPRSMRAGPWSSVSSSRVTFRSRNIGLRALSRPVRSR